MKIYRKSKSKLSNLSNSNGVTLIELIIVIALIGIVLNLLYSMNIFGIKTFAKGSNRYDLNSETNLVSENITKSIRYAYAVEILGASESIPEAATIASLNPDDAYIFISDGVGGKFVKYRDKSGTKTLGEFDQCSLLFKIGDVNNSYDKSISYTLTTSLKDENFSVYSGVVPVNLLIQNNAEVIDNTGTADGVALKIKNISSTEDTIDELIFGLVNPPNGKVGDYYSYTFSVSDGISPYTFYLSEATKLPIGVSLSDTGILSGVPLEAGSFTFVVRVNDGSVPTKKGSKYFTISISNDVIIDSTAPTVTNVNITTLEGIDVDSTSSDGIELAVNYQYLDPNDVVESGSIFSWWLSTNDKGIGLTQIAGAVSRTYIPQVADIGKYLYVKVIPSNGSKTGNGVFGDFPVKIVASGENSKPIATNVTITGEKDKGDWTLTGHYVYEDAGRTEGLTKYKWFGSKNVGDEPEVIANATSKILKNKDYKFYYFEVTPVSSVGNLIGDTVRSLTYEIKNNN